MPVIEIPDVATVDFPDSMSEEEIKATIKRKFYAQKATVPARPVPFVPDTSSNLPQRELPPYKAQKDTTDYAGESLLGVSLQDIPSGADTTAPAITIPLSAAAKTAAGAVQFATSPKGIAQIAAAATPAAPAIYAKWAYDMLKGGVESVKDAGEAVANLIKGHINRQMAKQLGEQAPPVDQEEVQRLADDAVNTAVGIIGGATAAGGAIHPLIKRTAEVAPLTADALQKETAQAEKGSDAIQRETTEVLQPVQPSAGEGVQQVPAERPSPETGARSEPTVPEKTQAVADYERYQEVQEEVKRAFKAGDQEAFGKAFKENEDIKNRYGGMPPPKPTPTVSETTPPVPPGEMPQSPTQTGLRPAIRVVGGEVVVGDAGKTHPDIIAEKNLKAEEIDQRGFVDEQGVFHDREQAAATTGLPTEKEAQRLHSTDLPEAKEATPQSAGEQEVKTAPAVGPKPKGIAASVRNKWTTATESPLGSEAGFINIDPLKDFVEKLTPYVKSAAGFIRDLGVEQLRAGTMDDYRRSVLNWSAKLQRSFGEASSAQREIQSRVPDPIRREGITNWIQADGDQAVLQQRLAATTNPKLAKGYQAALDLTPEEIDVAQDVRNAYNALGARGQAYDVLKNFKDNYVTQIWNLRKGPSMAGSRTLQEKFRFSKASTFDTFFDGEQAGYVPKTKDISKLLPTYLHEMNAVIAARQLVEQLSRGVASDGRPLVVPRGVAIPVDNASGSATLIVPKAVKGDTGDYKVLPNQPALNDWRWASKDDAGNPIFLKSDLALHPEAYDRLKNVLGRSAIREWYSTKTSLAAQIPKLLVHGLDIANSETKRTMLGLLAPFHQVQEGWHGIGHRTNPTFSIPKVDLVNDPAQMDAARHGLMLQPDRVSANEFMEGFRVSGLVSKIPGLGTLADQYSNYLFHQYIPGLKFKTYQAILDRNLGVYSSELVSGEISQADVKHLSAEQTNAAYGHLNYADLARNPTIQHIMQLGLLAPDFFEARARFTGQSIKGVTGAKVGREQVIALTTLAVAQAATAYTAAQLTGGQWDQKHPFEFHVGNRRYTMRSVPEDISSILNNTRTFIHSRISPIIGKGALQYVSGVDWRGQKVSAGQTTKELLEQPIPISIRGLLGLGRQSLSGWEQLASAVGLRISRYSPANDVFQMAQDWMKANPDPKVQKRLQVQQASTFPISDYASLRNALHDDNMNAAKDAYRELLKTKSADQVYRAMSHPHPFTGAAATDKAFVKSLTESQLKIYKQAIAEQRNTLKKFQAMRSTVQ